MDFIFQGFQSDLPLWVYVLLILGTTLLSWWSYKDVKSINSLFKYGLIFIRSLVFFILLLLLLNPFYKAERTSLEKSEILVLWDNSASTSIQKGDYNGRESYRQVIEELQLSDSSEVRYTPYAVGATVKPSALDSLVLKESKTNLYGAVETIRNREKDIKGAILITDGIFNTGRNPAFEAGNSSVPIMTVALGDTVEQKDLLVEEVSTNNKGFVNTLHPVEVNVTTNGYAGENVQVQLKRAGEVLQQKTVTPVSGRTSHTLDFELDLQEEGLQQYEISIPAVESEWTASNNTLPFAIDVQNNKQRILSLAFEIHPDVKFIRSVLLSDENTEMYTRTWLGGNLFIEGSLGELPADSLDLIILHGYPGSGVPEEVENGVETIVAGTPSVFIATPLTNIDNAQQVNDVFLPASYPGLKNGRQVQIKPNVDPTEHPIMELPEVSYRQLPPVVLPVSNGQISAGAVVLFSGSYRGLDNGQPLIIVEEIGNFRRAQISGYGWYRFGQNANTQVRDFGTQLFSNIINWTAARPDNRRLKIQPSKIVFNGSEPIVLDAYLTNESGEKESEGVIEIEISGQEIESRFYSMSNLRDGRYRLSIDALPRGIYNFTANARKGQRTIDRQKGEFSISDTNTEFINTNRDDMLLKQISERSGGSYFTFSNLAGFTDSLKGKGMLKKEEKVSSTLFYPYQHSFWFITVILLLTAEWITRKYFALT